MYSFIADLGNYKRFYAEKIISAEYKAEAHKFAEMAWRHLETIFGHFF